MVYLLVFNQMKVKKRLTKTRANNMEMVGEDLYKLGFYGGDIKPGKIRSEYYFDRKVWSDLVSDVLTHSVMRRQIKIEFSLEVMYDHKLNTLTWKYGSDKEEERSRSSGLHSKLVDILGQ